MKRDNKGRFAKTKSLMFWVVLILVFVGAYQAHKHDLGSTTTSNTPETTEQVKVENTDSRLEEIMNEEEFKKKAELLGRKELLDREKKEETELNDKNVQFETDRHNNRLKALKEKEDALLAEAKTIQLGFE